IYFAGGHGTMWDFADDEALAELTAAVYGSGGVVSAVCHGPAALLNVKVGGRALPRNAPVTGVSDAEEAAGGGRNVVPLPPDRPLAERGGRYSKASKPFDKHVVEAHRLITGQNPASTRGVAEAVVRALRG